MGQRRSARESALQVLFELEFNNAGAESVLLRPREDKNPAPAVLEYAARLVRGVLARRQEIDDLVQGTSAHWRVARMNPIDRNILRIAAFELLEERFLAPAIIINEAIEIAKRFSGEEGAVFVNGVLDAVRKAIARGPAAPKETDHEPTPKPRKSPESAQRAPAAAAATDRPAAPRGRRPKE